MEKLPTISVFCGWCTNHFETNGNVDVERIWNGYYYTIEIYIVCPSCGSRKMITEVDS